MTSETDLAIAERRSEEARQRLTGTLVDVQARLNPKALAREAARELKETAQEFAQEGMDRVRRHPLALAGVAGAIGLLLARGPLRHLVHTYLDETPEPPASLTRKRARIRRKGPSA